MNQATLISLLKEKYCPLITFTPGDIHLWSPSEQTVYYVKSVEANERELWTLLHETSHGMLHHTRYKSDHELVLLEVAAWDYANQLADEIGINIDQEYLQDCLDSYRDWQYKRSLCPQCNLGGIQIDPKTYNCLFCTKKWTVSAERFCRPYRKNIQK